MRESDFQKELIKEIKQRMPGVVILKNDANYFQGFPDLTILGENQKWATLECKASAKAPHRTNQQYYVEKLNKMGFSAFIFPENKEEILNEMERSFKGGPIGVSCIS